MEQGELKFLYETTINNQVEESVVETREEKGEKVEVKRSVKKLKPVKVAILKPDRKLIKAAEIFYAKTLADYLRAGLLPYSLVIKRYSNDGGPLSDFDKVKIKELKDKSAALQQDFFDAKEGTEEEQRKTKNDILNKINNINEEISKIENAFSDIFDSTAEVKARGDVIEWWTLHLIHIHNGTLYQPLFGAGDYDQKVTQLEAIGEKNEPFIAEVVKRLAYLISFWFTARSVVTTFDFNTMERLYIDTMSDYKVEVNPEPTIKVEDKTPEKVEAPVVTPTVT